MNHSKAFWAVRNQYAEQMRTLWGRGYSGEGLWGRGALLSTGEFEANTVSADEALPEHLCGGTYRSRGRKRRRRKEKQELGYQERKERRILRKFGPGGVALGEDEDAKARLENAGGSKAKARTKAKPRVASSNRGRDLRAAAALARFDQQKKETEEEAKRKSPEVIDLEGDEEEGTLSGADSDTETASETEHEEATVDINGQRLLDNKGHSLVKVCEDEDPEDGNAQNELKELLQSTQPSMKAPKAREVSASASASAPSSSSRKTSTLQTEDRSDIQFADEGQIDLKPKPNITIRKLPTKVEPKPGASPPSSNVTTSSSPPVSAAVPPSTPGVCSMCSFDSGPEAAVCSICSHVMDPRKVPDTWSCKSASCKDSFFLNAGDAGVCSVCGERKATSRR